MGRGAGGAGAGARNAGGADLARRGPGCPAARRLGGAAVHLGAGGTVGADLGGVGGAGGARAGTAALCRAWGAGGADGGTVHPAGGGGGAGVAGGVWPGGRGEPPAGGGGVAGAGDLWVAWRCAGPCVFQHATGGAADPAGLAAGSGRAVPAGSLVGVFRRRHCPPDRVANAAHGGAGGGADGVFALPHLIRRGVDAGRRAGGGHAGTGDLSGVPAGI